MKVVFGKLFLMKVVFDEIDHFHPNFDESAPDPFFSLSHSNFRSFLPSLGGLRGILVVFEALGRSNVHVCSLVVV